jgi:hypothetical protein
MGSECVNIFSIDKRALFDSEYGCAPLVKATAAIAADKLMRIRSLSLLVVSAFIL